MGVSELVRQTGGERTGVREDGGEARPGDGSTRVVDAAGGVRANIVIRCGAGHGIPPLLHDDIDDVAANMAALEMRRLPVVDRDKRLVGIVSLANFAHSRDPAASQELLRGVARPH